LSFSQPLRILAVMKILMIGEAAKHRETLLAHLPAGMEVVGLPRDAATTSEHDACICHDDVLITLRYSRRDAIAPKFRLLHVPGAGIDGIDFASLPDEATVCNVYEHETPIAEYVMVAMLDHEIGYSRMRADFKSDRWPDLYRARIPHGELHGKTLGLIGYGRIGREIAKRAKAFGMKVIAANRSAIANGLEHLDQGLPMEALGQLLTDSDYVVIACPLSDSTRGLIDTSALTKMHRSAVLINVSRAEIVDQKALYDALSNARIGGAVLDVWWHYPLAENDRPSPSDQPFDTLPNVYPTAHSSAWTMHLPQRRYRAIAQNIRRLMQTIPLDNVVRSPKKS
jgi:phosphoglycerate dehydrogenase-like enzyme